MLKKAYVWLILVLIALLVVTAAFIYKDNVLGNAGAQNFSASSTIPAGSYGSIEPVSAFKALSIADDSGIVKEWKADRTNVSVEGISTQASDKGVASTWTIKYAGDDEKATVRVDQGKVGLAAIKGKRSLSSLDTASMIDSDRAFSIASGLLLQDGYFATGPAAIELSRMDSYAGIWDIVFPVGNEFYIVRMDAGSGVAIVKTFVGKSGAVGMIRTGP